MNGKNHNENTTKGAGMGFMEQQIRYGEWYEIETMSGTFFIPQAYAMFDTTPNGCLFDGEGELTDEGREILMDYVDVMDADEISEVAEVTGYGARLSAPGYMDCTEWSVFDTEAEAQEYLDETYGDDE
jgi:hypothetical protein